jgi:hypothetical protein
MNGQVLIKHNTRLTSFAGITEQRLVTDGSINRWGGFRISLSRLNAGEFAVGLVGLKSAQLPCCAALPRAFVPVCSLMAGLVIRCCQFLPVPLPSRMRGLRQYLHALVSTTMDGQHTCLRTHAELWRLMLRHFFFFLWLAPRHNMYHLCLASHTGRTASFILVRLDVVWFVYCDAWVGRCFAVWHLVCVGVVYPAGDAFGSARPHSRFVLRFSLWTLLSRTMPAFAVLPLRHYSATAQAAGSRTPRFACAPPPPPCSITAAAACLFQHCACTGVSVGRLLQSTFVMLLLTFLRVVLGSNLLSYYYTCHTPACATVTYTFDVYMYMSCRYISNYLSYVSL